MHIIHQQYCFFWSYWFDLVSKVVCVFEIEVIARLIWQKWVKPSSEKGGCLQKQKLLDEEDRFKIKFKLAELKEPQIKLTVMRPEEKKNLKT